MKAFPTVAEATKQYREAKAAFQTASVALRCALAREERATVRDSRIEAPRRRTWREAREMAKKVHAMAAANPTFSQADIGRELGLDLSMVGYFLRSPKYVGILNE